MAAPEVNGTVLIEDEDQWSIYAARWKSTYRCISGDPLRFPCVVTSVHYYNDAWIVKHVFAYEEILLAYRKAGKKKNRKPQGAKAST